MQISKKQIRSFLIPIIAISLLSSACSTPNITNSKRSSKEELVLSTAIDNALGSCGMKAIQKKKIFIDTANLKTDDPLEQAYLIGATRAFLGSSGALLVDKKDDSEMIFELYSGVLATNYRVYLLGVPSFPVPVPFSAALVQTPELALFKKFHQTGTCKLLFNLVNKDDGSQIIFKNAILGNGYIHEYTILGISWMDSNIFENEDISKFTKSVKDINHI
ncbi:MAG: hypothetical protein GY756_16410 [bacterium]|nr:hypothetical protein [bacterium]